MLEGVQMAAWTFTDFFSYLRSAPPCFPPKFAAFTVLVKLYVYKLVVIVNVESSVDNSVFFNRINCLPVRELAGQSLYPG